MIKHLHRWRKVAGENRVYCQEKGCEKTRVLYPAGRFPWSGQTSEFHGRVFRECVSCGVFQDPDRSHVCDGEEGRQRREGALGQASTALNRLLKEVKEDKGLKK